MNKFVWKKQYYGYACFVLGTILLVLNLVSIVFPFLGVLFFLGGSIFNGVLSVKFFIKEKKDIDAKIKKMVETELIKQELNNENKHIEERNIAQEILNVDVKNIVDSKLLRDIKFYKHSLRLNILMYIGIVILSVTFLIRLFLII